MKKLEVRELLETHRLMERINEILRLIEEEGETFELTDQGKPIAKLVPVQETQKPAKQNLDAFWQEMDQLAARIGASWQGDIDTAKVAREPQKSIEEKDSNAWEKLRKIAADLEPYWPKDMDAVEVVRDVRRDL